MEQKISMFRTASGALFVLAGILAVTAVLLFRKWKLKEYYDITHHKRKEHFMDAQETQGTKSNSQFLAEIEEGMDEKAHTIDESGVREDGGSGRLESDMPDTEPAGGGIETSQTAGDMDKTQIQPNGNSNIKNSEVNTGKNENEEKDDDCEEEPDGWGIMGLDFGTEGTDIDAESNTRTPDVKPEEAKDNVVTIETEAPGKDEESETEEADEEDGSSPTEELGTGKNIEQADTGDTTTLVADGTDDTVLLDYGGQGNAGIKTSPGTVYWTNGSGHTKFKIIKSVVITHTDKTLDEISEAAEEEGIRN